LALIAVYHHDTIELERHPADGERRRDNHAHLGDFAGGVLLASRARTG